MSGGRAQRVALARSLVLLPRILLLDAPFASLDQRLPERLRGEVRDLQKRPGITMVFVTHGQDEALALADRTKVMDRGRAQQPERPDRLHRAPASPCVAGFIGQMRMIAGEVAGGRFRHGAIDLLAPVADGPALLAIRPEALGIAFGAGVGGCIG